MKLTIVFPTLNQPLLTRHAVDAALQNLSGQVQTQFLIIDNGSEIPFSPIGYKSNTIPMQIEYLEKPIGVYPVFWEALKYATGDIIAYFHSDLIIVEKGWDKRVMDLFTATGAGLVGFVGSNEIDAAGGRGLGTTSNFQGGSYIESNGTATASWKGSDALIHGKKSDGWAPAAVIDGCAMIFRREVLEKIRQRPNFPPHHFYDKLLSCETRELGYKMYTLGIACDHISGQTVNRESAYNDLANEWADAHGLPKAHNGDHRLYTEAERQWLTEYRNTKHLIPCRV